MVLRVIARRVGIVVMDGAVVGVVVVRNTLVMFELVHQRHRIPV